MTKSDFTIRPETAGDDRHINDLLDTAFGPGRLTRTAYRLREGVEHISSLAYVAENDNELMGSLRYWPVSVESGHEALLLGPLVIRPDWQAKGCGKALMRRTLDLATGQGHRIVVLVGDAPYYARVGFSQVPKGTLDMPGPVDLSRLLWLELAPGATAGVSGMIGKASTFGRADRSR